MRVEPLEKRLMLSHCPFPGHKHCDGGGGGGGGETNFATYSLVSLGTLGGTRSFATDINDVGQVVGQAQDGVGDIHAFLWEDANGNAQSDPGEMQDLDTLGGDSSEAKAVNNLGHIVGESDTSDVDSSGRQIEHAFYWSTATNMIDLGTLGGQYSRAVAVNEFDQVAGYAQTTNLITRAFLWEDTNGNNQSDPGEMLDLGTLPGGSYSIARGINALGQVVGDANTAAGETHAFLWLPEPDYGLVAGMHDLGTLGGIHSTANRIDETGQVFGSAQTGSGGWQQDVRFGNLTRWDLDGQGTITATDLDKLKRKKLARPTDIANVAGSLQVVGNSCGVFGVTHGGGVDGSFWITDDCEPFVWQDGEMANLRDLIVAADGIDVDAISTVGGVNSQGTLASGAPNTDGDFRAFIAIPNLSGAATASFAAATESGDSEFAAIPKAAKSNKPGGGKGGPGSGGGGTITNAAFVFVQPGKKGDDLYLATADGSSAIRLTDTGNSAYPRSPEWSPDGSKIAFLQDSSLRTISSDGTGEALVIDFSESGVPVPSTVPGRGDAFAWSPDGTQLIYAGSSDGLTGDLLILDLATGTVSSLKDDLQPTGEPAPLKQVWHATWSPDLDPVNDGYQGKILFVGWNGVTSNEAQLYMLDIVANGATIETGDVTQLGDDPGDLASPSWSPDGTSIVYKEWDNDVGYIIQRMPVEVSGAGLDVSVTLIGTDVLLNPANVDGLSGLSNTALSWSPDSQWVTFDGDRPANSGGNLDLFRIRADGTELTNVTPTDRVREQSPDWNPAWINDIGGVLQAESIGTSTNIEGLSMPRVETVLAIQPTVGRFDDPIYRESSAFHRSYEMTRREQATDELLRKGSEVWTPIDDRPVTNPAAEKYRAEHTVQTSDEERDGERDRWFANNEAGDLRLGLVQL